MIRARKAGGTEQDRALVESFLDMMSAERGASPNTIAAYRRDILDFAAEAARSGCDLASAGREHIRNHLARLSAAAVKASSQARKLSALRGFYGFLYSEAVRRDDPCGAVEAPRLSRPLPKILSAEEALKLVEKNGIDNLHMAFYKNQDIGNDSVWDVWQIEGPAMLWYFRGDPHVHTWVHIRRDATT